MTITAKVHSSLTKLGFQVFQASINIIYMLGFQVFQASINTYKYNIYERRALFYRRYLIINYLRAVQ